MESKMSKSILALECRNDLYWFYPSRILNNFYDWGYHESSFLGATFLLVTFAPDLMQDVSSEG